MIENKQEGHLRSYLREFAQGTTLHGVRYVGDNKRHWTERLCWMVAMSLCIAICSYQVFNVYTRWHVSPVIFTFAQRTTRVRDIPFPAVTVCPMLQIPRETLDLATVSRIVRTLHQPFWVTPETSSSEQLTIESASYLCKKIKIGNYSYTLNASHLETMIKLVPKIEYFVQQCHWGRQKKQCQHSFRPILTSYGICHTFNMKPYSDIFLHHVAEAERDETEDDHNVYNVTTSSGRMNGLRLVLRMPMNQSQYACCPRNEYICHTGFQVLIHPPTSIPVNGHVDVLPWSDVDVKLYPEITTTDPALRSYSPDTRGCRFPEEHNRTIFKTYSRGNCKVECTLQVTEQICKCREFFIPLDPGQPELGHCKTRLGSLICSDMQNLERPNCDECLPSCNEIRYEKYVDRGQLVAQQLGREFDARNSNAHPNYTKFSYSRLRIYFDEDDYIGMHRSEVFGLTDVISNCGGLLGLFTGCSVITLIEILYFATLRIFCTLRHRHRPLNGDEDDRDYGLRAVTI